MENNDESKTHEIKVFHLLYQQLIVFYWHHSVQWDGYSSGEGDSRDGDSSDSDSSDSRDNDSGNRDGDSIYSHLNRSGVCSATGGWSH